MNRNLCNYCGFLVSYPVLGRRPRGCPCRQAPYCDALCQRRNWRRHKSLCLWYCLMFKVQEVVEFPEEIVIHICKFAAEPSQRGRKKRKGTFNLSMRWVQAFKAEKWLCLLSQELFAMWHITVQVQEADCCWPNVGLSLGQSLPKCHVDMLRCQPWWSANHCCFIQPVSLIRTWPYHVVGLSFSQSSM